MPVPDTAECIDAVAEAFRSRAVAHPLDWSSPGPQFTSAFAESDLQLAPNPHHTLFRQSSLHRYHVEGSRELGRQFDQYVMGICRAMCAAIGQWLRQAGISGVSINGGSGVLPPGGLHGPALSPLILEQAPTDTHFQSLYSKAIARAFGEAWGQWQQTVQGCLAYPELARWPGAIAEGVANSPVSLLALTTVNPFTGPRMYPRYRQSFADDSALHSRPLFYALAFGMSDPLQDFLRHTRVRGVLARGPVPTWNPPTVSAGPVAGGTGEGLPGCIR